MKTIRRQKGQNGFTLLEVVVALIIFAALLPTLFSLWESGMNAVKARQAAEHLVKVSKATAQYVKKHQDRLALQATPSGGPELTVADLIDEELLPEGFTERNAFGQTYRVYIRQPRNKELHAVTLTFGGRGHDDKDKKFVTSIIPSAASMAGASGGFVPGNDIPGLSQDMLRGAFGGWTLSLSGMGIASPGPGHLGALANFDEAGLAQDFLYRVAVPGNPELNAMRTELDMTDHALRGVQEIQFTPREYDAETCTDPETEGRLFLDKNYGLYLCRNGLMEVVADTGNSSQIREMTIAQNGDTITKPICPPGTDTIPQIFTAPSLAAAGFEAPPITAFQSWATSLNDTQWQVHLRLLTTDKDIGWVYPLPDYARIHVLSACVQERATP